MTNKEPVQSCQHCGKPIGDKSIQGLCPACLMKAGWPTSQETESGTGAGTHLKQRLAGRTCLVFVVSLLLFESTEQISLHWRESSGELWSMAVLSLTLGGMVWAVWPLRSHTRTFWWPVCVGLGLSVAHHSVTYYYAWHIRPNLGLYQESDWVSQHPGFQRDHRKRIAANLWGQEAWPATFDPTSNITLPRADVPGVTLVDFDTSRSVVQTGFMTGDSARLKQMATDGWDLAAERKDGKVVFLALRTHVMFIPEMSWEDARSQDIVGYWKLEKRLPAESKPLRLATKVLNYYFFQTGAGGMGLMQIMGSIDDPNGMNLRYKCVHGK